jgi:hypothetical protein
MVTLTLGWRPADNERGAIAPRPKDAKGGVAVVPDTDARRRQPGVVHRVISDWMERWPAVFCFPPRPLAVGIHAAVMSALPELPVDVVHGALRDWTSTRPYQHALGAAEALRVGLDGVVVVDSLENQAMAAAQLAAMRPKPRRR